MHETQVSFEFDIRCGSNVLHAISGDVGLGACILACISGSGGEEDLPSKNKIGKGRIFLCIFLYLRSPYII